MVIYEIKMTGRVWKGRERDHAAKVEPLGGRRARLNYTEKI